MMTFTVKAAGRRPRRAELVRRQRCRQGAAGRAGRRPRSSAPAASTATSGSNCDPQAGGLRRRRRRDQPHPGATSTSTSPGGRATSAGGSSRSGPSAAPSPSRRWRDTRVRLAGGGGSVRLADLGTVRDGWEEPRQHARLDGKEVVAFSVLPLGRLQRDRRDRAVARRGRRLDASRRRRAREVTSSVDVSGELRAAVEALWIGALLAVGVVWLFLRDIRATLISSVALPLSLIPTFAVMRLLGPVAQQHHPAGAVAGGRHPGGRRHRRDREHRPPHAPERQARLGSRDRGGGRDRAGRGGDDAGPSSRCSCRSPSCPASPARSSRASPSRPASRWPSRCWWRGCSRP